MTYDPSMTITSTIPAPEGSDSTSFSQTSRETFTDKVLRLIQSDVVTS